MLGESALPKLLRDRGPEENAVSRDVTLRVPASWPRGGRARGAAGFRDRWHGDLGDVQVHDRVVVPGEVAELPRCLPVGGAHLPSDVP